METILLRTLTKKSSFSEGKYAGVSIGHLLDLKYYNYLRWAYYCLSKINFVDEILNEIGIVDKYKINKPGINPEMLKTLQNDKWKNVRDNGLIVIGTGENKIFRNIKKKMKPDKTKLVGVIKRDKIRFSKSALQHKNHGH